MIRLLFNRNQTMRDAIRKGKPTVWLTDSEYGTRINYYNPKRGFWGGSNPVERHGLFSYRTYLHVGGDPLKKEVGESAAEWVRKVLA